MGFPRIGKSRAGGVGDSRRQNPIQRAANRWNRRVEQPDFREQTQGEALGGVVGLVALNALNVLSGGLRGNELHTTAADTLVGLVSGKAGMAALNGEGVHPHAPTTGPDVSTVPVIPPVTPTNPEQ